jgi:hypothetical protein
MSERYDVDKKDAIDEARMDAAYRSLNAWRGAEWLLQNPRKRFLPIPNQTATP